MFLSERTGENLVPSNNASSAPENPVSPKAQENPWYIQHFIKLLIGFGLGGGAVAILLPLDAVVALRHELG